MAEVDHFKINRHAEIARAIASIRQVQLLSKYAPANMAAAEFDQLQSALDEARSALLPAPDFSVQYNLEI